jgi:hypothetical protein
MRFNFLALVPFWKDGNCLFFITHETGVGVTIVTISTVPIRDLHTLNPWMCLSFTPVYSQTPLSNYAAWMLLI